MKDRGADSILIKSDVAKTEDVQRMFRTVRAEFVHNARPAVGAFYTAPLDITLEKWQTAFDSQAKAMLLGCQEAGRLMTNGGRIIAITYAPGSRTGSWQPWIAMGEPRPRSSRRSATSRWRWRRRVLCSDEARWIIGQTIYADGGGSLMNSDYPLDFQRGG